LTAKNEPPMPKSISMSEITSAEIGTVQAHRNGSLAPAYSDTAPIGTAFQGWGTSR
jgi:hypothetical protein